MPLLFFLASIFIVFGLVKATFFCSLFKFPEIFVDLRVHLMLDEVLISFLLCFVKVTVEQAVLSLMLLVRSRCSGLLLFTLFYFSKWVYWIIRSTWWSSSASCWTTATSTWAWPLLVLSTSRENEQIVILFFSLVLFRLKFVKPIYFTEQTVCFILLSVFNRWMIAR